MRELSVRAMTGAAYVALTLGAAWAGPFTTFLLFLPVCVMALREMHLLYRGPDTSTALAWSMLMGATVYVVMAMGVFEPRWHLGYAVAIAFILLLITITWWLIHGVQQPGHALGGALVLLLLVALPFGLLPHFFLTDPWMFIGFMVLLWTNDTGAYLVGRLIGRTKLLPAVSPKKTVEGAIGGLGLTVLVGWLLARTHPFLSIREWITVAVIISITATLGDLLESAFKRARGVKDSGHVLPGHGGILDRFDGFLLAVPAVAMYLSFVR